MRGMKMKSALACAMMLAGSRVGRAQTAEVLSFKSRPDLTPVALVIVQAPNSTAYQEGMYFTGPAGPPPFVPQPAPVIYTSAGDVVWVGSQLPDGFDVRTQMLNGEEVLTTWSGFVSTTFPSGFGIGRALVYNSTYDLIYNLTTSLPWQADLHEFTIPPVTGNTALITSYFPVQADLSSVGGETGGWILDAFFQEIDIESEQVLFTWNASSHTKLSDSFLTPPATTSFNASWDYFHINSVDKDATGDYLISARHFHQLLKLSHETGEVLWTMGGKNSSFAIGEGANFEWQHDARWVDPTSLDQITVFDDASNGDDVAEPSARGLYLDVDYSNMSISLRQDYFPFDRHPTSSQGSTRILPDGNVLVGWGSNPWISEYLIDGTLIYSAALGAEDLVNGPVQNYRAFKSTTWKGIPQRWPDVNFTSTDIYASWNGATEVAKWQALVGSSADNLTFAANATKTGFETHITVDSAPRVVQVRAYDANGVLLGASAALSASGEQVGDGFVNGIPGAN